MSDPVTVLDDLNAESEEVDSLVRELSAKQWAAPTPAAGWTVAHQIAHLAWTDRAALLAATDPEAFAAEAAEALASPGTFVDEGAEKGAALPPAELLAGWRDGRERLLRVLREAPPGARFPWYGPPMSALSLATARLMETWAHGQDVADALGVVRAPTARLRHVAWIGLRARDYAYLVRGLTPPAEPFRLELISPEGELWAYGPEGATQIVRGPALDFCLLVTQRVHHADTALVPLGAEAAHWLTIAQAFAGPAGQGRPPKGGPEEGGVVSRILRIGNASGFYGDRFDAVREMLTGAGAGAGAGADGAPGAVPGSGTDARAGSGGLDVLTGDYLAELTMLILGRDLLKDPSTGYAKTFLRQMEEGLGLAHERGVRIVANAGGLNPAGLADALRALAGRLGIPVRVAHVEGDRLPARDGVLAANAYLGGAGIAACLDAGADVVVTGRVTDAALVTGPAQWFFGWGPEEYDRLAGAVVAGHVLECGTQATGGNYAFFTGHDPKLLRRPGFPLAELHEDGSAVVTKHPGTGGVVDTGTVTAQLLYETGGARYAGPDVTARLDTVRLTQEGPDRVRIDGVRGEAPPPTLKAGLCRLGGFRNEVVFVLTGLDIEAKAELVRDQIEDALARGPKPAPAQVRWELARTDRADAGTEETASALLRLVVRDPDPEAVGRTLSGAAIELALASYPGFHVTAPPGKGAPYGVFETAYVPVGEVPHTAVLPDGSRVAVPVPPQSRVLAPVPPPPLPEPLPTGPTRRAPLGLVAGARSGDKGGDANVGVWVRDDRAWRWLAHALTVDLFRQLLPETEELAVERHLLPGLRAVNFTVTGLLGEGVASQARFDPQAKGLGEWLRSRHVDLPEELL